MTRVALFVSLFLSVMFAGCRERRTMPEEKGALELRLLKEVNGVPGTVGIAFVCGDDTVTINNGVHYAMMSVFKLHEALAVCDTLEKQGISLDSMLTVQSSELDLHTWSPMLRDYSADGFDVSVRELIRYALVSSDNNASNLLFSHIISPVETAGYIRSVAADTDFAIRHSEAEMKRDHDLSYDNYTSPLAAALLIRQVFLSEPVGPDYIGPVKENLCSVTTGQDRLGAPFAGKDGVLFAHKTGSGYRNTRGELMAHNDVAYVRLPDGRDYSLAVMIRDFAGDEAEASRIMARISHMVYDYVAQDCAVD